ncbi:MAG: hypothetical protein BWY46_01619 [Firmicutes bacterium ADurb.Bin300]|jgi:hypothetical protein|nr:MAG: hypothetical protein BWY46_01619 [Firmicutes bacterium ADurb.Bin300]
MHREDAYITMRELKRDFYYDDILMISFSSSYPQLRYRRKETEKRVNSWYLFNVRRFLRYTESVLFRMAVEQYKEAIKNDFPFRTFSAVLNYTITYNSDKLLSLYGDRYEYTGGAHGSTKRISDTWNLTKGRLLPLSSFFPLRPNYQEYIINQIIEQANADMQENPYIYFDNYQELIKENFNPQNYYLTGEGIVIYFQQYEIAPYATGIPEFTVKP